MLLAPLPPLALALPGPALRLLVTAATLYATWAVARFLAVGIAHHRREAQLDRRPPTKAEVDSWRRAIRRDVGTRWAGPLSPRAALAAASVARLVGTRPPIGREPGLHLVVGPPGTGTSAALSSTLEGLLDDPHGPPPLLVDAAQLARVGRAGRSVPDPLDHPIAAELTDLTGMPGRVADLLAGEVVLLVDGFEDLLTSSPEAAADLLAAFGGRPDARPGPHAVVAFGRQRDQDAATRRIVVATTPAGYTAFERAGLTEADGPLATVTHLEPVGGATVRAAVAAACPPCPGLVPALDRLPGLALLLGHPLWLDVAFEVFGREPDDGRDRPTDGTHLLDHLPDTASPEEIAAALWDQWLDQRLSDRPQTRHFAGNLARRHPTRSQPTFHLHDLGGRGTRTRAWSEGMTVGTAVTFLVATLTAVIAPGWGTVALGMPTAVGAGSVYAWVLQRHERWTGRLGPVRQAEGTEDGDGPALAGVATALIVMLLVAGPFLLAGAGPPLVLLLWPLLIAVPLGVTGWLAFRARLGIGQQGPALLTLGAFGGTLGALVFVIVAGLYLGSPSYPFPGDPANLVGWWTGALIVGPLVGLVDGMGVPGPGPVRLRPGRVTAPFVRSFPPLVVLPVIGSVLVSGALLLGVLVQPTYAGWLAPFAAGGLVIGMAAWVAAGATAGFTPDPVRRPSTDPGSAIRAELHRTMWRVPLVVVVTALVAVPTGWLAGAWLSRQQLGPTREPSFLVRDEVPMVGPVLTGVAVCVGLWLLVTLATTAPVRQRVVQAVAAARGRVPGDYPAFLDELVAAGVLHRCGAGYRFRHPALADHLAGRPTDQPAVPPAPHDAFDPAPPPVAV